MISSFLSRRFEGAARLPFLDRILRATVVAAAIFGASPIFATDSTWVAPGSGNWSDATNWSAGAPNGPSDAARFLDAITAPATITQDLSGLTLGLIEFNNAHSYTISGNDGITMQLEAAGTATLSVNNSNGNGAHTIAVPIILNHPLLLIQNSSGALTVSGAITGGQVITKAGAGTAVTSGTISNGINGITVQDGVMVLSKSGGATAFGIGISTLTVGDGIGGAGADRVILGSSDQLPTGVRIFITASGVLDGASNFNAVTGGVTMTGGMILNPRLRLFANTHVLAHTEPAVISGGSIEFAGATRSFVVADGSASDDMVVNSRITNGGLIKAGAGQLVLGGAAVNDFAAGMTVNSGTVIAAKSTAFGAGSLAINSGTARLAADLGTAVQVTNLAISGSGVLDLTDNKMVVNYTGASPLHSSIQPAIISGYALGAWNGSGINSSTAAANPGFGIGYAEASSIFGSFPASFGGIDVDSTSVLMSYARYGDANLDGVVGLPDFNRLAANFGSTSATWDEGDFNYDLVVNLQDFNRLAANFGLSAAGEGPKPQDWANLASVVPEPLWGWGLMAVTCGLLRRRAGCRRSRSC